jgi:hypothetical protein
MLSGSQDLLSAELLARIEQGEVDAISELDPAVLMQFAYAVAVGVGISGTLSYLAIPLLWFRNEKLVASIVNGCKVMALNWRAFSMLALVLVLLLIPAAALMATPV